MQPIINSQLPEFSVQAFQNGQFKTVTDKDVKGKWGIFFFYPADFTFVCPTELVDMAEKYEQFQAMGVEIYSVSTDSHFVHKAWHDASESIRKIKYPMYRNILVRVNSSFDTDDIFQDFLSNCGRKGLILKSNRM